MKGCKLLMMAAFLALCLSGCENLLGPNCKALEDKMNAAQRAADQCRDDDNCSVTRYVVLLDQFYDARQEYQDCKNP